MGQLYTLSIDIETYSQVDIKKAGMHKYAQDPSFEILLFSYAYNNGDPILIDMASGEEIPANVIRDLYDPQITKTAFNAAFEMACINEYLAREHFADPMPAEQWQCTMVKCAMVGLPMSLDMVGQVLKLDQKKDRSGYNLIRFFCIPCKPTKANDMRVRNYPHHDPEKWRAFKEYNVQDVRTEQAILKKIDFYVIPATESRLWALDQRINTRGALLDMDLVNNAIEIDSLSREQLLKEAIEITGLRNPNSTAQLSKWLQEEMPLDDVDTLRKADIPVLLGKAIGYENEDAVIRVLQIRQELAKTSVKKYQAMAASVCLDNCVRGMLQLYGASRTGRWAGRMVQLHNLPKNFLKDLDAARQLVAENDFESLYEFFGNVPDTLSQLIRTAFIAHPGHVLCISDFSAIEARVVAWLADEEWRLDVFNTHGKIYEASASKMFNVPLESVTKGSDLRDKGKISELALGYQGSVNALYKMGAIKMGIVPDESDESKAVLQVIVDKWRAANTNIVQLWYETNTAAIQCVKTRKPTQLANGMLKFFMDKGILFMQLPSGRSLSYFHPYIGVNSFNSESLFYEGIDQKTKQWSQQQTYGGKLIENAVQAISRDLLAEAMLRIDNYNIPIVLHVHDEVVIELPENAVDIPFINKIMGASVDWAPGLPLTADTHSSFYYKKD